MTERDFWKNKRVLITGGAGFIGQHLSWRLLEEKVLRIICVDKRTDFRVRARNLTPIHMNITQPNRELEQLVRKTDIVFHLANDSSAMMFHEFAIPYHRNIQSLLAVLNLASRSNKVKRIVFPSSSTVYSGLAFPWKEDASLGTPVNWYAASKMTGEMLCRYYNAYTHVETVCLRIFCGYGPGEEHKGTFASPISLFFWNMAKGKPPGVWGDGTQERDFIYIDDIVDSLLLAASEPVSGEVFNVGTGRSTSFLDVVRIINDTLRTDINATFKRPGLKVYIDKTLADCNKAERILNFKAKISLRKGIERMVKAPKRKHNLISKRVFQPRNSGRSRCGEGVTEYESFVAESSRGVL